jgi:benzoate transport
MSFARMRQIDDAPMSRFQVTAIAVCLAVNMLDGFDVLAIAFAAPAIARDWALSAEALGLLFSAGLAGMMAGSLAIAPLADVAGRRPVILLCLVLIATGMLASAAAPDARALAATRVLTGLGIGGALASLNTIVAEYSSRRWRDFAVSLLQTGYPIGATVGGTISAVLLVHYGWRSVFVFGGVLTALAIPLVLWRLPESVDFLLARRPRRALERVNGLLARLGQPALRQLPPAGGGASVSAVRQIARLLSAPYRRATLALWTAFFMVMCAFYFALNWTPKILVDGGLSVEQGVSGGVVMNVGGIVGAGLLGWMSARVGLRRLVALYMIGCATALAAFGRIGPSLPPRLALAAVIGFLVFGSMVGLYAIAPSLYPPEMRTTGIGWAIGLGRGGAIVGPYVAGLLLARGWDAASCYALFAVPLVASTWAVMRLPRAASGAPATATPPAAMRTG